MKNGEFLMNKVFDGLQEKEFNIMYKNGFMINPYPNVRFLHKNNILVYVTGKVFYVAVNQERPWNKKLHNWKDVFTYINFESQNINKRIKQIENEVDKLIESDTNNVYIALTHMIDKYVNAVGFKNAKDNINVYLDIATTNDSMESAMIRLSEVYK